MNISLIKRKILIRQYIWYAEIVNLIDYKTNVKVNNYVNFLFIPVINKQTRISGNNATIIHHINTIHFLNNDMDSGIITPDISDHIPIFLISKELILDSSN